MAIISPFSIVYSVISGENKGRVCVIRNLKGYINEYVGVIFIDNNDDQLVPIKKAELAQLEIPGWPQTIHGCSYGLKEHFKTHSGDGTNMLRTSNIAQPMALRTKDILSTGEIVVEDPRGGYNSSSLIHLDKTGWVELAPRLPIALAGNKRFRLPGGLTKNDRLSTGCLIVKAPISFEVNWTDIFLDRDDCCISVPSCIPLALA